VERSRGGRPWKWHRLAHVCQRWRYVVSISPRRLRLQITCKSGAPIEPVLDTWPTLPIVVRYKGSRKPRPLPSNIVAAFRHPDRVCDIDIGVTSSVLESMVGATQRPFPLLERVRIASNDSTGESVLPSPGNFMGGSAPRLQNVYLDGIVFPFPELRRLLISSNHLVELRLCNITDAGYFSPHALVSGLSALARLKRLEIHFHRSTFIPTPRDTDPPPPLERASLPSLTFLAFHGISTYLEGVVARIDFPSLTFAIIKFLNQFVFEIPQLCRFIGRVDALKSPNEVIVKPSQDNSSITFTQRGERRRNLGEIFLVISGGPLDWQLSSTIQIFTQLSPLLSNVKLLAFGKYPSAPAVEEDVRPYAMAGAFPAVQRRVERSCYRETRTGCCAGARRALPGCGAGCFARADHAYFGGTSRLSFCAGCRSAVCGSATGLGSSHIPSWLSGNYPFLRLRSCIRHSFLIINLCDLPSLLVYW
jgi:hypothetical protein